MKQRTNLIDGPDAHDAPEGLADLFAWDDLQFFLELARRNTLAKAARRLGVAHTTVLRRIANLERRIDRKLFERTQAGFVLNEAGWQLLEYAEAMERAADSIYHLGERSNDLSGSVRVASIEGLAARALTPAFPMFHEQHPGIAIEIVTAMQVVNLTKREADISVGVTRPTGPRLFARRLAACDVHLYASRGYLERHGAPSSVEDLQRHLFVDYIDDMIEMPALRWLSDTVGQARVVFRSTSPLAQLEAVRSGIGIGMFPEYMTRGESTVRPILTDQVRTEREFWLAIHKDLQNVPRMAAVFNFLKGVFEEDDAFRS